MQTFQSLVFKLNEFWANHGCIIGQPYGMEVGAATANPNTFFRVLGPEPFNIAYVEPSRRPADGRYGQNPNRFQHYFQYQVILKPVPLYNQELYVDMLRSIGIDPKLHDIRFVEDNWESIPIGAWGLGWEVWCDGMEVSQYTYFQQMAGIDMEVVPLEITLGLERLAMYLQDVDHYKDLKWNENVTYYELFERHEYWQSKYNFEDAEISDLQVLFNTHRGIVVEQIERKNYWAAYDNLLKLSHLFNLLNSRAAVSVSDRASKFTEMAKFSNQIGVLYLEERKKLEYPLKVAGSVEYKPDVEEIKASKSNSVKYSNTYVLELGFEELPAEFIEKWSIAVRNSDIERTFGEALDYTEFSIYFSARRIVFRIEELKERSRVVQVKGPIAEICYKDGEPTQVLEGFMQKNQLTLKDIKIVEENGKKFVVGSRVEQGSLKDAINALISQLFSIAPIKKKMRWDSSGNSFVRPLRWIISKVGQSSVDVEFMGVKSGDYTMAPRYETPKLIKVSSSADFFEFIDRYKIVLDAKERKQIILSAVNNENVNEAILGENIFLTESPTVVAAKLESKYSELPPFLMTKILEHHQRYLVDNDVLSIVVNKPNLPDYDGDLILKGNLKVANARLDDGLFYLREDRKHPLKWYREGLKRVNFHYKYGTYYDKVERVKKLVEQIYTVELKGSVPANVITVLELLKNDKATLLGNEFPELEGAIASFLAENEGYPPQVYKILVDSYAENPTNEDAKVIALADNLDSFLALSVVEKLPEGGNDPFQIRRFAQRTLKLLLQFDIDLNSFIESVQSVYQNKLKIQKLLGFINVRFNKYLVEELKFNGILAQAVSNGKSFNYKVKLSFITELAKKDTTKLLDVVKRVRNILDKAEFQQNLKVNGSDVRSSKINIELLTTESEKKLNEFLNANIGEVLSVGKLIELGKILELFFNETMVMDKDERVRENRLSLLRRVNSEVMELIRM